ncbi:MAG: FtsX-like permease family protein [Peptococcaceae bacterium]|nr:FtsX-like permease family protein [Peptococcaceae bacterium]
MVMDNGTFDVVETSMNSLQGIATMILYIAVGAAVVTLSLLITLFLRDRKHEIGIYLSLGERKIKVAGQIFMEVAVVAVIAITLSLFSGNIISGALSEQMLVDQIVADQTQEAAMGGGGSGNYSVQDFRARGYQSGISAEDLAASYEVSLNMIMVLLFYAVGFATVCVSVLVPIIYVTRLNPKKILMGGS